MCLIPFYDCNDYIEKQNLMEIKFVMIGCIM